MYNKPSNFIAFKSILEFLLNELKVGSYYMAQIFMNLEKSLSHKHQEKFYEYTESVLPCREIYEICFSSPF